MNINDFTLTGQYDPFTQEVISTVLTTYVPYSLVISCHW